MFHKRSHHTDAHAPQLESGPCSPQLGESLRSSKDPAQPKINKNLKKNYKLTESHQDIPGRSMFLGPVSPKGDIVWQSPTMNISPVLLTRPQTLVRFQIFLELIYVCVCVCVCACVRVLFIIDSSPQPYQISFCI